MDLRKEFEKENPEVVGETDRDFYDSNYIEWLESRLQWISVEERLPEPNIKVLGLHWFVPNEHTPDGIYDEQLVYLDGDRFYLCIEGACALPIEVTHWMPLPSPPSELSDSPDR